MAIKIESLQQRLEVINQMIAVMTGVKDVYFKEKEDKDTVVMEANKVLMRELKLL